MEEAATKAEAQDLREKFGALKKDLAEVTKELKDRAVTGTREWAKEHPVAAVGVVAALAGAIGFLVGLLVGRNRG